QGIQGGIQAQAFEEILAKVKTFSQQITATEQNVLQETLRWIDQFNQLHPEQPLGEGTERLLLARAKLLASTEIFNRLTEEEAKNEDMVTKAYLQAIPAYTGIAGAQRLVNAVQTDLSKGVFDLTEELYAELQGLTLSREELLRHRLAALNATDAQQQ